MSANNITICPKCSKPTLKESYEISIQKIKLKGINDAEFYVHYSACCNECGFEFEHHHTEVVNVSHIQK